MKTETSSVTMNLIHYGTRSKDGCIDSRLYLIVLLYFALVVLKFGAVTLSLTCGSDVASPASVTQVSHASASLVSPRCEISYDGLHLASADACKSAMGSAVVAGYRYMSMTMPTSSTYFCDRFDHWDPVKREWSGSLDPECMLAIEHESERSMSAPWQDPNLTTVISVEDEEDDHTAVPSAGDQDEEAEQHAAVLSAGVAKLTISEPPSEWMDDYMGEIFFVRVDKETKQHT